MAYDPEKDVTIFTAPASEDGTWLEIKSYQNGEPKVALFKNSSYGVKPVYRLSSSDFAYIGNNWESVKQILSQYKGR
jgi:hypothetical protein